MEAYVMRKEKARNRQGILIYTLLKTHNYLNTKKNPAKKPTHHAIVSHQIARDKRNTKSTDSESSIC